MGTVERESRQKWTHTHLLKGKIRTFEGHAMSPGSVQRPVSKRKDVRSDRGADARRIVRYYVSQKAVKHGFKSCPIKAVNAAHIDDLVRGLVLDHLKNQHGADLRGHEPEARDRWIREVVHWVMVAPDRITVELVHNRSPSAPKLHARVGPTAPHANLPLRFRRVHSPPSSKTEASTWR